ncbi:MAG: hypothetical protein ACI3YC_08370 [Alloprevotella sp.]
MSQFCFKRFAQLVRLDIRLNRYLSTMIGLFLGYFFGLIGIYWKNTITSQLPTPALEEVLSYTASRFFLICTVVYLLVGTSMMFRNLSTKQSRLAFFMLPASNAEKMLSRFFIIFLFFMVWPFIAYPLADLLRVAILSIFDLHYAFSFSAIREMISEGWTDYVSGFQAGLDGDRSSLLSALDLTFGVLGLWLCQVAGSLVFSRRAFLYTNLILFLAIFTLAWSVSSSGPLCAWVSDHTDAFEMGVTVFFGVSNVFLLGFIPWKFCHKQVQ